MQRKLVRIKLSSPTPPTTPPMIAPTLVPAVDAAVAEGEEVVRVDVVEDKAVAGTEVDVGDVVVTREVDNWPVGD